MLAELGWTPRRALVGARAAALGDRAGEPAGRRGDCALRRAERCWAAPRCCSPAGYAGHRRHAELVAADVLLERGRPRCGRARRHRGRRRRHAVGRSAIAGSRSASSTRARISAARSRRAPSACGRRSGVLARCDAVVCAGGGLLLLPFALFAVRDRAGGPRPRSRPARGARRARARAAATSRCATRCARVASGSSPRRCSRSGSTSSRCSITSCCS